MKNKTANKKLDLSQEVMKTIKQEKVQMRPHWHFVLGSFLLGFSIVSLMTMAIFTANLVFFHLRMHQWRFFLYRFPWLHLLTLILLLITGLYLLKKYEFSYKQNWKLIVLGLLGALLLSGFMIDRLGVNEQLQKRRPMRRFYEQGQLPSRPSERNFPAPAY